MRHYLQLEDRLLEIGVGSGFTANYLRSMGFNVTTIDIDEEKKPNIVTNIVTFHPALAFDHILAFEVFEHIPFPQFERVVHNLSRKCNKCFFVSLPQYERVIASLVLKLPKLGKHRFALRLPGTHLSTAHHHWEIGYKNIDEETIVNVFARHGFYLQQSDKAFCRRFFAFCKGQKAKQKK
jgi:2-polyprenyl-3-methyl-5-hydroxy-6-metoxy-1,4-benzoquinol methylase